MAKFSKGAFVDMAAALRAAADAQTGERRLGVEVAAEAIADVFAADNSKFDREAFLATVRGRPL